MFWAFWTTSPSAIIKDLLDAGCGRRDNTAPAVWCQKVNGSEVIEAVKSQNQVVPLLLGYGLAKECEDCFGSAALLHALDCGLQSYESAKALIDAGANLFGKKGRGFTPFELVKKDIINCIHDGQWLLGHHGRARSDRCLTSLESSQGHSRRINAPMTYIMEHW